MSESIVPVGEVWLLWKPWHTAAAAHALLCTRGLARQDGYPFQGWFSMAAAERQVSVAFLSGTVEPGHLERRSKEQGEGRGRGDRAGSC